MMSTTTITTMLCAELVEGWKCASIPFQRRLCMRIYVVCTIEKRVHLIECGSCDALMGAMTHCCMLSFYSGREGRGGGDVRSSDDVVDLLHEDVFVGEQTIVHIN